MLALLSLEPDPVQFVRSTALLLENAANPLPERAARVDAWLNAQPVWTTTDRPALAARVDELMGRGCRAFDALHVACAEQAQADFFVTVDSRLLRRLKQHQAQIRVRACSPIDCLMEVSP
ncbi:MAG TPA: hypothetical protein PKB10_04170 [Tepidisphaeraceae bacterium]|nr:hypothetical protein [Tepidisphaeraceae bacterium]